MVKWALRALVTVVLVAVLSSLLMPSALAGKIERFRDVALFRPDSGAVLEAGGVKVVVPPEALDRSKVLRLVVFYDGEWTDVTLKPDLEFDQSVLIDFGTTPVVHYWDQDHWVEIITIDADYDGEVGEILVDHFSRWAWW